VLGSARASGIVCHMANAVVTETNAVSRRASGRS
jgi:hypothetical protein